MNWKRAGLAPILFLFLMVLMWPVVVWGQGYGIGPVAVSPGSEKGINSVAQGCPTFSWSALEGASSYRIAVFYAVDGLLAYEQMASQTKPMFQRDIAGPALAWTLPEEDCLPRGRTYVWYVCALDESGMVWGDWSLGRRFRVEQETALPGLVEKLERILKSQGVSEEVISHSVKALQKEFYASRVRPGTGETVIEQDGIKGSELTYNTFYGLDAGDITTGIHNSFFGYRAGRVNTVGARNSFIGDSAGYSNTEGNENIFIGYKAGFLNTVGGGNVFIGNSSGYDNTTGEDNTITGNSAGANNTTGSSNCFYGYRAGFSNTIASYNSFFGFEAGYSNLGGNYNCFVGKKAGYYNNSGNNNSFFGSDAGYSNTSGGQNCYFGYAAGYNNQSGISNAFLGTQAGYLNSSGSHNVFLGYQAGYNEMGSQKLYIANSDTTTPLVYGEFDNDILTVNGKLGINTKTPTYNLEINTTGSNPCIYLKRTDGAINYLSATPFNVNFGSASNHPLRLVANSAVRMVLNTDNSITMTSGASCTSGGVWTNASSRALKENIQTLDTTRALATLAQLEPVVYNYKTEPSEQYVGFIAEDVPELVATNDRKGLSPMDITAVLTRVLQEQQRLNQDQQNLLQQRQQVIQALLKENEGYKNMLADIQTRLNQLESLKRD